MPEGVYIGGGVTVVMDPPPVVYARVFYSGSSPDRHLRKKTVDVYLLAKVLAPRQTGRLAASIEMDQNRNELGQYAFGYSVGTPLYYAHYVHEGTGPSVRETFPKAMRFLGTGRWSGTEVFTDIVFHPGTPAQPFLQDALVAMAR